MMFSLCSCLVSSFLLQIMVAQTAPAVRVAIGEEAGLAPGSVSTGQMVAGLKRLGFDYVFDTGGYLRYVENKQ
jgi:iron only hydrogenase large subunit-like protein